MSRDQDRWHHSLFFGTVVPLYSVFPGAAGVILETLEGNRVDSRHNHRRMLRLFPVYRECGRMALLESIGLQTHDPLAHVRQGLERGWTPEFEARMYRDFVTDIAERDPDAPFNGSFNFVVEGDSLLTEDGDDFAALITTGLEASRAAAETDSARAYGVLREEAQARHVGDILSWYYSDQSGPLLIASLCPGAGEVPDDVLQANGFKVQRRMASMWVYAKQGSRIEMSAFSLDHLTLAGFAELMATIGVNDMGDKTRGTTLEQLSVAIVLPFEETARDASLRCIEAHDKLYASGVQTKQGRLMRDMHSEANARVEARPEAYYLYRSAVLAIMQSLQAGEVSQDVMRIAQELSKNVANAQHISKRQSTRGKLSINDARDFVDYLRSQVIPQYVFGADTHSSQYEYGDFSGSGGDAVASGKVFDGACPGSSRIEQSDASGLKDSGLLFGWSQINHDIELVSRPKGRGDCTACPEKSTTLFGCGFCKGCNEVWCHEYKKNGRGLSVPEVSARRNIERFKKVTQTPENNNKTIKLVPVDKTKTPHTNTTKKKSAPWYSATTPPKKVSA